ncbi:MAG: HD domain-containing protein [Cyanobacteria bacterium P01_F01_bin.33]
MMFSDRYERGLIYASQLHLHQFRKVGPDDSVSSSDRIPYVTHLVSVSIIARDHGADEDQAIAALLHDAIEDGPEVSEESEQEIRADIRGLFGDCVLRIVEGCSQSKDTNRDWWERKREYVEHIPQLPAEVRLVSNSDKLHNVRCILRDYRDVGDRLWERFSRGKRGVLWYHWAVASAFKRAAITSLSQALMTATEALLDATCISPSDPMLRFPEIAERKSKI